MSQIDKLLQEELQLQRIATGLINKGLFPSIDAAYKAIRLILLDAESITSPTKLKATERAIATAINEALTKGWADYTSELGKIAIYDSAYYAQLIGTAAAAELTVPAAKTIQSFIDSSLMSLSRGNTPTVGVWAEFVRNNIDRFSEQVNNLVKAGYVNNATVGQMTRTIKQFNDGLAKQQAEALARTGTQHFMQSAREAMGQANADIIAARVFFATMDNRVSVGCASLHLKEWAFTDDGYVRLPRHFNCRSTYLFRLKGQSKEDMLSVKRPAIGSGDNYPEDGLTKKKYRELPDGTFEEYEDKVKPKYRGRKDSENGRFKVEQVDSSVGFDTWLKRQDREFVEDVLGAKRAKLFIDGNLPLERMSDAFGKELSLAELAAKNAKAFEKPV